MFTGKPSPRTGQPFIQDASLRNKRHSCRSALQETKEDQAAYKYSASLTKRMFAGFKGNVNPPPPCSVIYTRI